MDSEAPCPKCGCDMGHGAGLGLCSMCLMGSLTATMGPMVTVTLPDSPVDLSGVTNRALADSAALGALRAKLAALCERWEECATRPLTESDYQNPAVTSTIRQICDECARELREAMGE